MRCTDDRSPLGLAGIWEEWKAPDDTLLQTFSILTTTANKIVAPVHDRMPVIIPPDEYSTWLSKHITNPECYHRYLLNPFGVF